MTAKIRFTYEGIPYNIDVRDFPEEGGPLTAEELLGERFKLFPPKLAVISVAPTEPIDYYAPGERRSLVPDELPSLPNINKR
jgi:hypothetical protein